MNLRTAKLEWDLTPTLYEDENSYCLIVKFAQNGCGEAYINPCDHSMGFLFIDDHYLECLRDTLKKNNWFDVPPQFREAINKLGQTILEHIEKNPSSDNRYCFLASDEF